MNHFPFKIDEAYDDGVVCFGPVTDSQLERYSRLPRCTVMPSELKNILCSDDAETSSVKDENEEENAKDEKFDENCDESVKNYLDQSKDSSVDLSVVQVDESNTTPSIIDFDNKENEAMSSKYSASSFTSPCASQFVPSVDLIATEVLNRYIRMETTISDESFSEDQDKSAFEGETISFGDKEKKELNQDEIICENVSFSDVQKEEIIHDKSIESEITNSYSPVPVSSVIEQSYNGNESTSLGDVNNICSLKHRSHDDDNDESICSISEFEDDSIVPDKYSITPGKQRLFDVRNLKKSFHVKTSILMERIEESTTPVILKSSTSQSALNEVSCTPSEIKTNLDDSLSKSIDYSSSAVDFSHVKDSMSNNSVINASCDEEKMCINNVCDEPMSTNSISAENNTLDSDVSLSIINNSSKGQSNVMRQYLDLNQTQIENVSSAGINSALNESEDYCDQSQNNFSIIEQTTCSETTESKKNDESFSILDDLSKSTLSVIIENRTLEDEEIIVHSDDEENIEVSNRYIQMENTFSGETVSVDNKEKEELNHDEIICTSYNTVSKNIVNEKTHNEMLIDTTQEAMTNAENDSKSHAIELSTMNVTNPLEKEVHQNINNFTDQSVIGSVTSLNESEDTIGNITLDSCFLLENSAISRIENKIITEVENKLRFNTSEQILSQNTESNDWNLTDISILNTSELILKSEHALQSLNQRHSLNTTDKMSESLAEFNKIEKMFIEENDKVCEFKTPKTQKLLDLSTIKKPFMDSQVTQKLLDFSIIQQSPFLVNSSKKQKLINFSIVDQSPAFKTTSQTSLNHNSTKADTSFDFNSTNQMWDLGTMPANEIDFHFPNSLLTVSSSNVELVADESVKTNSSDHSDKSLNQTITEANLLYTSVNQPNVQGDDQLTEKDDLTVSTNKQLEINESSNSSNTTVAQNESCNEQPIKELTTKGLSKGSEHLFETSNIESIITSNQQVTLSSNEYGIQDFSIVEQSTQSKSKNVENIIPAESAYDVSNLIEMSVANTPCNKQFVVSDIPILTSHEESEKTLNSSSSDIVNNTAIHFEESRFSSEELLTDVQMNDVSLIVESSDKSSVSESFHSIELDHHIQEDKKRKIDEPVQGGYHTDKKVKVNNDEDLKTPTSMLYKIRNMFKSSEKQLHISSNTKENDSGAFRQKLDFNKVNDSRANVPKSINYKKPEALGKSRIPCKVTDVSITHNDGFNVSSSVNDNNVIKPKKTIPKFSGLPVLSDVSNSTKKCPGNLRTPSRFQQ